MALPTKGSVQVQWAPPGSEEDPTGPYVPHNRQWTPGSTPKDPYSHVGVPTLPQVTSTPGVNTAPSPLVSQAGDVQPDIYDINGRSAQLDALKRLQGYAGGGPDAEDTAQQAAYTGQQNQYARAAGDAQQSNLRARGYNNPLLAGLGQQVQAQQQGMAANQQGLDMAAYGRQRALQSMSAAGALSSTVRQSDWNTNLRKSRARDIINNANVNANNTVGQGRVDRGNTVGQYNAGLPWQISGVQSQVAGGKIQSQTSNTTRDITAIQRQKDQEKDAASGAVGIVTSFGKAGI